uniref:T6SS phospholipase effector Tle1-like catalytic domain-containing protein n=1 Tax=Pseudomonas profundi TaxID=1981513 RepID=UPI0016800465
NEEQIFIHAQRDWDQNIQHNQSIRVGNERHDRVEANSYTELLAEEHHTTHSDRRTEIKAEDHLTAAGSQHVKVGAGQFIETGHEIHYHAGNTVVIDAGMELTAKGGGSFLKLDPSGVTLNGASIKINSGGSAGNGAGVGVLGAALPFMAAVDQPGHILAKPAFFAKFPEPELDMRATPVIEAETVEDEEEEEETELPLTQLITLRIGVFFDGTGNNKDNSQSVAGCRAEDVGLESIAEDIRQHCASHGFDGQGSSPDNSYGNDVTNVARLYDLYRDESGTEIEPHAQEASVKVYLEGIGTRSGSLDSMFSQGTGQGGTGVRARVEESPSKILSVIRRLFEENPNVLIENIEFDVFGFSRGAAAARDFVNELKKGSDSLFAAALPPGSSALIPSFNWRFNADIRIGFVGLFDTVAGIVSLGGLDFSPHNGRNPGLKLEFAPDVAKKVVQLVARDELRHNFSLNSAGSADLVVPGVHSDIGGGYMPLAQEKVLLSRPRSSRVRRTTPNEEANACVLTVADMNKHLSHLQRYGTAISVENWAIDLPYNRRNDLYREKRVFCAIKSEREVSGALSLVYFHVMRELAVQEGVPMDEIPAAPQFALPQELESIYAKILDFARGKTAALRLTDKEEALLYRRYIHLSANWNAANGWNNSSLDILFINRPAQNGKRVEYQHD